MSSTLNVFGNVREYDTDLDVFGVALEWDAPSDIPSIICVPASITYRPGFDAVERYRPGSVASEVYRPGFDAIQERCCQ